MRYGLLDFESVAHGIDAFYCPGCNATAEDYTLPSVGCPCAEFAEGTGSLRAHQVARYLFAQEQEDTRPPLIVGYEFIPFITTGEPRRTFYCPIHSHYYTSAWPSSYEPIWRGEVPEDAECAECGIALKELE
jgi:hypothetical protein